jgi:hypothetical protein
MGLFTVLPEDAIPIKLSNGQLAHLLPYRRHPQVFEVVYQKVLVGCVFKLLFPHRTIWECAICEESLHGRKELVQHHVYTHFAEACRIAGVAAPGILSVGHVPDFSGKARMPWRIDAPEFK